MPDPSFHVQRHRPSSLTCGRTRADQIAKRIFLPTGSHMFTDLVLLLNPGLLGASLGGAWVMVEASEGSLCIPAGARSNRTGMAPRIPRIWSACQHRLLAPSPLVYRPLWRSHRGSAWSVRQEGYIRNGFLFQINQHIT